MKAKLFAFIVVAVLSGCSSSVLSQSNSYKGGSEWNFVMIHFDQQSQSALFSSIRQSCDEAVEKGLILSYKLMKGPAMNPDDFDLLLLEEYSSIAAMESSREEMFNIRQQFLSAEALKLFRKAGVQLHEVYGKKNMSEVVFETQELID